jgi:hypothetical protein
MIIKWRRSSARQKNLAWVSCTGHHCLAPVGMSENGISLHISGKLTMEKLKLFRLSYNWVFTLICNKISQYEADVEFLVKSLGSCTYGYIESTYESKWWLLNEIRWNIVDLCKCRFLKASAQYSILLNKIFSTWINSTSYEYKSRWVNKEA